MSRGQGTRNTTREELHRLEQLHRQDISKAEIARRMGRSKAWVSKHLSGKDERYYTTRMAQKGDIPPPLRFEGLNEEARRCLNDFRRFRNRYFQRSTPNFQLEVADRITALKPEEPLLAFWPPGFGKTTMVSHDYPIWRMLRARAYGERFACMLISKSENMGKAFLLRIKRTLEHNAKLQEDFGWFKPEHPDMWTKGHLQVDGFDPEVQGKEPTFIAAGSGSHIYGWRVDLIICDDLIDKENANKIERMDALQEWFHEEVESRLEKGASLAVCGTRFSMHDLYGRLIALRDEDSEELLYNIVRFPAHDDSKCVGKDGPHPEYPDGCHLWPDQKSYRALSVARQKMGTGRFDFVYNQVESSDDDNLFQKEWIEAAKDKSRVLWHIPRGIHKIVCTLDPSPTKFAVAEAWGINLETQKRYLIAIERDRMTVGGMIELFEEWTLYFRQRGKEPLWFFEKNAAQRWLFQSLDYKLLRQRTGIRVHDHETTARNKSDPEYGMQMLAPLYEYGQISIPWGDPETRNKLQFFISELMAYPNGTTNDGVMAQWFFEWNMRKVNRPKSVAFYDPAWSPQYLKDHRKIIPVNRPKYEFE